MNQRPQVSDEELKSFMDFSGVLTQHDQQIKIIRRTSLIRKIILSSIGIVIVGTGVWLVLTNEQKIVQQEEQQAKKEEAVARETQIEHPEEKKEQTPVAAPVVPSTKELEQEKSKTTNVESTSPPIATEELKPAEESSYVQAEPAAGYQELYDYFAKNLVYPREMMKDSIEGVSTATFIINKEGDPVKIEIVNSLGPAFDKEIARLIESMPDWKPALLNGKPVPSRISLPFTFQLQKVKSKQ